MLHVTMLVNLSKILGSELKAELVQKSFFFSINDLID